MNVTARVRYVANGFILTATEGRPADIPAEQYVGTLQEVVFWIDKIFAPPAPPAPPAS